MRGFDTSFHNNIVDKCLYAISHTVDFSIIGKPTEQSSTNSTGHASHKAVDGKGLTSPQNGDCTKTSKLTAGHQLPKSHSLPHCNEVTSINIRFAVTPCVYTGYSLFFRELSFHTTTKKHSSPFCIAFSMYTSMSSCNTFHLMFFGCFIVCQQWEMVRSTLGGELILRMSIASGRLQSSIGSTAAVSTF